MSPKYYYTRKRRFVNMILRFFQNEFAERQLIPRVFWAIMGLESETLIQNWE